LIISGDSCSKARLEIFLVEDNPCDVVLFKQILRKSSVASFLTVVSDGTTAIERLEEGTRPDAIFLDLNLPGKTGHEILAELKESPALAAIPVAVLTGSDDHKDQEICKLLGAERYFSKAAALDDLVTLTLQIATFLQSLEHGSASTGLPGCRATSAA
jgi:two-component system response regulator